MKILIVPIVGALAAFMITLLVTPWLIKYLKRVGMTVFDVHKKKGVLVPLSGGLAVLAGFFGGSMMFIFFRTFFHSEAAGFTVTDKNLELLFASLLSILIITVVGFIDDILVHKSKIESAGLNQWQKPLLTLSAAVPLMVINAGTDTMLLPFIGHVNFGILYPLVLVPIGILGASNMVNMLAGLNGLEVGSGIIYLTSLGSFAYYYHRYVATLIGLMMVASLCAFYFFNKYPAKILPGNSLTYMLGATIAAIAIVGNIEKAALTISIPFIIEFILKIRGKLRKTTIGYSENGLVKSKYKEIYSIPHIFMRRGLYTEKQVVYYTWCIILFFSVLIWIT